MIRNPLASPLFAPTMARLALLLLLGTLLVAIAERRHLHDLAGLRQSTLFKRVLSWAMMAPTFALGVFAGGPVALVVVLLLVVQAVREFARVAGMTPPYRSLLLALGVATVAVAAVLPAAFPWLPLAAFAVVVTAALARGEVDGTYRQLTFTLFGYMWLPLPLGFLPLIGRGLPDGTAVLLLVGMAVALSDIGAFVAGNLLGGPRLSPAISPNKTVAGLLGNVLGAYAALGVMAFAIPPGRSALPLLALPAFIAAAGVWGDLLESLVKRTFAVKDAGTALPGFGGVLDRIDSLIAALPVTYLVLRLAA